MSEHVLPSLDQHLDQQQSTTATAPAQPPLGPPLQQEKSYHEQALEWMQPLLDAVEVNKPDEEYIANHPDVYMQLSNIATASQHAASNLLACKHAIYMCIQFLMDWMPDDEGEQDDISLLIQNSRPYQEAPQNIATVVDETITPTPVATEGQSVLLPGATEQGPPAPQEDMVDPLEAVVQQQASSPEPVEAPKEEDTFEAIQQSGEAAKKIPTFVEAEDENALPQIAIRTDALIKLINKVERGISNKTTRDIEKYIYFEFTEERAMARTTNSHFMAETSITNTEDTLNYQLIGEPSLEVCFLGSMLIPMAKKITLDNILITYDRAKKLATIDAGNSEMIIHCEEGSQFDMPPRLDDEKATVLLPIDYLHHMYQSTVYASAEKNQRPSVTGVNHEITKQGLQLTATDGYRLSRQTLGLSLEEAIGEDIDCTVPREVVSEIMKLMNASGDDHIELRLGEKRLEYILSDSKIYSRLIESDFPNVEKMINEDMEYYIDVPHKVLKEALMFTSMFEDADGKKMLLLIKPKTNGDEGQLRIATPATEKGKYTQDAVIYGDGSDMTMQINFKYLADALRKYPETSTIRILYMQDKAPILVRDASAEKGSFDVLLPIVSPQSGMSADIKKFKGKNQFNAFKTSMFDDVE